MRNAIYIIRIQIGARVAEGRLGHLAVPRVRCLGVDAACASHFEARDDGEQEDANAAVPCGQR